MLSATRNANGLITGGGEMGHLTRSLNWSATSLGSPDGWPKSLKTTVNTLLASKFPMFLWWGEELIQFYNDAYRNSLGNDGKHPAALGARGKDTWPEVWPVIYPMIESILNGGEASWNENQLVPIYRNGELQDVYWTFSYSPVTDDNDEISGVLVIVMETTKEVETQKQARSDEENLAETTSRFKALVDQVPVAICVLMGQNLLIQVPNDRMLAIWGRSADIIGLPLEEALPELIGQPFLDILQNIFKTGETYEAKAAAAELIKDGIRGKYYFDFTYKPLFNSAGEVYGIMNIVADVTEQTISQRKVAESQKELLSYFEQSPIGVAVLSNDDLTFRMANPFYGELVGREVGDLLGKPLLKALPELEGQGFDLLLKEVIDTGVPYKANEVAVDIIRNGVYQTLYVNLLYQPRFGNDEIITGVLVVAVDVTQQVESRRRIEEDEARFRTLIEEAPVGTCLYVGKEMRIEVANEIMLGHWGKDRSVIGMTMAEALPEMAGQPYLALLDHVFATGTTYEEKAARAELIINGVKGTYYFDFTYKPLRNSVGEVYGILDMAVDVTSQVLGRREVEESENKLRGIISSAPAGIGLFVGRDLIIENPNQTFIKIVGKGPDISGRPLREVMPELVTEGQPFLQILDDVFTSGKMFQSMGTQVKIMQDGVMTDNYYNITYTPLLSANGEVYAILDIAIDVTDQVRAQQKLEEAESALRDAIELAELAPWNYDVRSGLITYSDRLIDWYGIDPGNNPGPPAPVIHEKDRERMATLMGNALQPGSTGLLDAEYMITNIKTGQQRIIHSHGKTNFDEHGNPVRMNGTSQDITLQRQNQLALEAEVQLRTEQLATAIAQLQSTNEELEESNEQLIYSNDELAQYAYVASHDLQEPLRKIRVFTSRLTSGEVDQTETKKILDKISGAAERMTSLIKDLLNFSRLLKNDSMLQSVNLTDIVHAVANDFELTINETQAEISIGQLPSIQAVSLQMNQLFFNLLSNSLKFISAGKKPVITISSGLITHHQAAKYIRRPVPSTQYYEIRVRDNGIGFEAHYAEQIFEVFKRLHGREIYPGSGIGLSLCRRIAENHNGFLYADSEPGKGTTFHLIVPAKQQP